MYYNSVKKVFMIGNRRDYDKVHRGYGFGEKSEAGERILDFVSSYRLAIVNTIFRKRKALYNV